MIYRHMDGARGWTMGTLNHSSRSMLMERNHTCPLYIVTFTPLARSSSTYKRQGDE